MGETKDVLTIYTNVGYAKVICAAETTVKEMISMAMRTVSLSTASQLYGLRMPHKCKNALQPFRHILCRKLTWERLKSMYNPKELILSICLYPTKFEEAARSDRTTLFYLHQQAREMYYARFSEIHDVEMAFEIGCLDIRSIVFSPNILPKDLMELVEKARPLQSFFPPCVTQQYKVSRLPQLHFITV
ncbi:hypothetical protein PHET_08534 [Paragonimus heterotremus]|uniref:FERM domain-containing protein n=1 Tax=Paragonimus heterotremus TaxID=100268 RepID=A0A8J4T5W4_9TREM|nr:hypothetical protein PHET_08534 [Paragonimus heterotremus]